MSLRTVKIQDIAATTARSIAIGPFGSNLKADLYTPSGVPVVRGQNIKASPYLDEEDLVFVSEETAEKLSFSMLNEGDLVFPHRGAIGRVGIVGKRRMLLSSSMMKLTVDPLKVDPLFVLYYFRGPGERELLMRASTVGTPGIGQPLTSLRGITIELPSLADQQAIAEVLGALDDKIAANTKLAATATALVQSVFQRLMKLTDQETSIGEVLTLEYGKSLAATKRVPGTVDVFGSGGIVGNHDTALLTGPGVIVGRKGTAGAVHWSPGPYFPIDTTYYAVPRNADISQLFAYFLLRSARLDEMNSDSAVPGLNRNEAHAATVKLPTSTNLQSFTSSMKPVFELATQSERENRALAATRDALLPQLMSGKLRVKDAERLVSATV